MSRNSIRHVTHINASCHTYQWVILLIWISHVTQLDASCHTYECVLSNIPMRHFTDMNESCHTIRCVMSHISVSHVMSHAQVSWWSHTRIPTHAYTCSHAPTRTLHKWRLHIMYFFSPFSFWFNICASVYMYVCMSVYVSVCLCVCIFIRWYVCVRMWVFFCCTYVRVCMWVFFCCMYVCIFRSVSAMVSEELEYRMMRVCNTTIYVILLFSTCNTHIQSSNTEWVTSLICMSHATRVNELCLKDEEFVQWREWITSHIQRSDGMYMN